MSVGNVGSMSTCGPRVATFHGVLSWDVPPVSSHSNGSAVPVVANIQGQWTTLSRYYCFLMIRLQYHPLVEQRNGTAAAVCLTHPFPSKLLPRQLQAKTAQIRALPSLWDKQISTMLSARQPVWDLAALAALDGTMHHAPCS